MNAKEGKNQKVIYRPGNCPVLGYYLVVVSRVPKFLRQHSGH